MNLQAEKYLSHVGHPIEVATYGDPVENVAIECMQCFEVLTDEDVSDGGEDALA